MKPSKPSNVNQSMKELHYKGIAKHTGKWVEGMGAAIHEDGTVVVWVNGQVGEHVYPNTLCQGVVFDGAECDYMIFYEGDILSINDDGKQWIVEVKFHLLQWQLIPHGKQKRAFPAIYGLLCDFLQSASDHEIIVDHIGNIHDTIVQP